MVRLRPAGAEGNDCVEGHPARPQLQRLFEYCVRNFALRHALADKREDIVVNFVRNLRRAAHKRKLFGIIDVIILHSPRFSLRG